MQKKVGCRPTKVFKKCQRMFFRFLLVEAVEAEAIGTEAEAIGTEAEAVEK